MSGAPPSSAGNFCRRLKTSWSTLRSSGRHRAAEGCLGQGVTRDGLSVSSSENFEQREFGGGQRDAATVDGAHGPEKDVDPVSGRRKGFARAWG